MGCTLLGGPFALAIQGVLFISTSTVLYLKFRQPPRRTVRVFCLDASKQVFGAGFLHIMNILFADVMSHNAVGGDPCSWYAVNLAVDCTFGVLVCWFYLQAFLRIVVPDLILCKDPRKDPSDFDFGNYYLPDGTLSKVRYVKQMFGWMTVVFFMKCTMLAIMTYFAADWLALAEFVLGRFDPYPKVKLVVVMCITPAVFNALQFWLQDNFLRKQKRTTVSSIQQPLLVGADPELGVVGAQEALRKVFARPVEDAVAKHFEKFPEVPCELVKLARHGAVLRSFYETIDVENKAFQSDVAKVVDKFQQNSLDAMDEFDKALDQHQIRALEAVCEDVVHGYLLHAYKEANLPSPQVGTITSPGVTPDWVAMNKAAESLRNELIVLQSAWEVNHPCYRMVEDCTGLLNNLQGAATKACNHKIIGA
mmetsp:Transcript_14602/g.32196  ORF Transcript_14602/g.32196 Transcript_14602/m.32196 type:complete len:421 (+) Transcript_14602:39-1301(+)